MTYGIEVYTSNGYKDASSVTTMRMVEDFAATTIAGSLVVSNFSTSRGNFFGVNNKSTGSLPQLTWQESTKTFTWGKHNASIPDGAYTNDFHVYFLESA